jgi:hypothetical protein
MIDDRPGPRTHRLWYPMLPQAFEEERPPEPDDARKVRAWLQNKVERELAAARVLGQAPRR